MIWTIIITIIVIILVKFLLSLNSDMEELSTRNISEKFEIIHTILNNNLFDGDANITIVDKRTFNLYREGDDKIIQFFYSTGNLEIKYREKQLGGELTYPKDYPNLRHINNERQKSIALDYQNYLTKNNISSEEISLNRILVAEPKTMDNLKYEMNYFFYNFCFGNNITRQFLDHELPTINMYARNLMLSPFNDEPLLELLFTSYLKLTHNIELEISGYKFYKYNNYEFLLMQQRVTIKGRENFLEFLNTNFENIIDKNGEKCTVVTNLIVYVADGFPRALFVNTYEPAINGNIIHRIFVDGSSSIISTYFENDNVEDEDDTLYGNIMKYINITMN